ncbi:MAG: c-type cytochrome biogenesis protein CcmI, partial [Patescibacteria group bacterium]|nr:c-type cytochrome biogenesis protein CcmI [Patescibacteria group bacterium]
ILMALSLASVVILVLPLARKADAVPARLDYDLAVYRDQLRDIGRDCARGTLDAEQAAAARVEIERRILAAADAEKESPAPRKAGGHWAAILLIALLLPVAAFAVYFYLGAPELIGYR